VRRWGVALLVLVAACRIDHTPTEIVVTVDTSFGVPCTIDTLHFEIVGDDTTPITEDVPVTDADLPGSITLVPEGNPAEVTVTVTGMRQGLPFAVASDMASFDHNVEVELRFELDESCVPGPCPAVGVGGYVGLPTPEVRRGCGSNGYQWLDSVFTMRDACDMGAMGTVLMSADEMEASSTLVPPMPFPFNFYDTPVTQLWVGDNGYIGFGSSAPDALIGDVGSPRSLGEPSFPVPGVLAFWDNLNTGPKGVCLTSSGTLPNRILWITWKEACFSTAMAGSKCGPTAQGTLTFSIALEETTDRVYIGYEQMVAPGEDAEGLSAVIGVTSGAAPACADTDCSTAGVCMSTGMPCGYTEFSALKVVDPLPTLEFDPQ